MAAPLLTLPTNCAAQVTSEIVRVVGSTMSPFTLEEQDFIWPGERLGFSISLPPITNRDIADQWIAFGDKMKGKYGRILMGDLSRRTPRGAGTGTPLVDGINAAGAITLPTRGWTPNVTNILKAGDYIQLGSGSTAVLNRVTENVDSDASGEAVLPLAMALKSSYNDGSAIVVNDPKGRFKLVSNTWSYRVTPGMVHYFSFDVIEAIP